MLFLGGSYHLLWYLPQIVLTILNSSIDPPEKQHIPAISSLGKGNDWRLFFVSKEGKGFPSFGPATPHNFPAQIMSNVSWVMKNSIFYQPAMPVKKNGSIKFGSIAFN